MKTLIVYGGKYGATKEIASRIQAGLKGESELVNVSEKIPKGLEGYDQILLGTSIYAGQANKALKAFCQNNEGQLLKKKVGIFFVCLIKNQIESYLKDNFSPALVKHFYITEECGGAFNVAKMNFVERIMTKMVVKGLKDKQGEPIVYSKQLIYKDFNDQGIQKMIDKINKL